MTIQTKIIVLSFTNSEEGNKKPFECFVHGQSFGSGSKIKRHEMTQKILVLSDKQNWLLGFS